MVCFILHYFIAFEKTQATCIRGIETRNGVADDSILVKALRDWLSWIFNGLPLDHVVRIIDCYLVEGHKFVTRAAIAIINLWSKSLKNRPHEEMRGKSQEERIETVKMELANAAQQIQISAESFIQIATRIRNLQSSTITRLQAHFENKLREEVNRRQSLKRSLPRRTGHLFTQPFSSAIVDQEAAAEIMSALPPRLQLETPKLLFRLSIDGASFTHLWSKIDCAEQSLLLIRTTRGEKFGAYCSSSWAERNDRRERSKSKYFGTGESFIWVLDRELGLPIIYGWVGNNNENADASPQMFMAAGDKLLVIGSGDGDAIRISEELTHGMSSACRTLEVLLSSRVAVLTSTNSRCTTSLLAHNFDYLLIGITSRSSSSSLNLLWHTCSLMKSYELMYCFM
ncbi:hypothetical protein KIN20_022162 [Parelaphostrongylus tenuis]|uniref:TLDc domain-containing protein n=1 Tax=Parelaphostrongylus tenuis TaxID=148309 RepID=A0AAD5QV71_PARTN|nr:hypothetical protein KIN20_022162 [Parelaphostrongylus tenuis]